jgi:flagellar hook-associated protein 2
MASIQSLGIGSGLLTNELVDSIIATEREPAENRLNAEQALLEARISAYGEINASVSAFSTALQSLSLPSTFNASTATSSNESAVTATASSVAVSGNYLVEVEALASSHSLASGAYENLDDTVGSGSLTFRFGKISFDEEDNYQSFTVNGDSSTKTIAINSTNNTLAGVRDAVNSADFGVQASIIDDGSGFRLLFTSKESGADNSLEIVATGDSAVQAFNYNLASESVSLNAVTAAGSTDLADGGGLAGLNKTFSLNYNGVELSVDVASEASIDTTSEAIAAIQSALDAQLIAGGFNAGDVVAVGENDRLRFETLAQGPDTTLEVVSEGSAPTVTGSTTVSDGFDFASNNATFSLAVDGGLAVAVTVDQATASRAETLDAVNGALTTAGLNTAVVAEFNDNDEIVFRRTEAGADKSIAVSAVDASGSAASAELGLAATTATGLGGFGLDVAEGQVNGSSRLLQTIQGSDALLRVNGLSVTRESNLVAGVISGTTLNLRSVTTGPVTLNVSKDVEAITEDIQGFVDAYNDLKSLSDELTAFDPAAGENGQGSLLIGDSTLRTIVSSVNGLLRSAVSGLSGNIRSLSEIGISTNQNNRFQLSFNRGVFAEKYAQTPEVIKALFANAGSTDDSQIDFVAANAQTVPGSYDVEVTALATVGSYRGLTTPALAAGNIVVDDDNDNFSLILNGIDADITLTQGTYTDADELAQQIQLQINSDSVYQAGNHSVTVVYDDSDERFVLESNVFGATSNIKFTAADAGFAESFGLIQAGQGPFQGNQLGGLATATGASAENFSTPLVIDSDTSFELDIGGIGTGLLTIPGSSGSPSTYNTPDDLIAAISAQIDADGSFLAKPAATQAGEVLVAGSDFSAVNRSFTLSLDGGENNVTVVVDGDSSTTAFGGQTPTTLANTLAAVQAAIDTTSLSGSVVASLDDSNRLVLSTVGTGADAALDVVNNGSGAVVSGGAGLSAGFDFGAAGASFELSVDGEPAIAIALNSATASLSESLEAIQTALDNAGIGSRVTASLDGSDQLVFTRSSANGADTSIELSNVSGSALTELGLANESAVGLDGFALAQGSRSGRDATEVAIDYVFDDATDLGRLVFSSNNNGAVIEFDNVSTNAATSLGVFIGDGTVKTETAGLNVAGKINGIDATGSGQLLRAGTGNNPAKPGFYLNNAIGNLASSTTNDTFTITVDGITSSEISLGTIINTDTTSVAASLQAAINGNPALLSAGVGVNVEFDTRTGGFGIISRTTGPTSSVNIASVSGNAGAIFGFSAGAGVRGAVGTAAQGLPDASAGLSLRVTGGAIGNRGSVSFVRGIADQMDKLLDSFLNNNGLLRNRTSSLNKELEGIASERVTLNSRLQASEERLKASFLANDLIISNLNTTADFLSSQLRLLEGLATPNKDD